ncbi:MAG: DUF421 domain-containing protein [Cyclobacteriaceae bacterium]
MRDWFYDDIDNLLRVGLSCLVFYVIVIVASKLAGLRSFSTFSTFDFLITLAMGALLATTIVSKEVSIVEGSAALVGLYILQMLIAWLRQKWSFVRKLIDNPPVLLMRDGQVLYKNLKRVKITEDELKSKLRQQSILHYDQVKAVVLESSGDISIDSRPLCES